MAKKKGYAPPVLDTELIKSLREGAGLTQDAAAKAAGATGRQWWNNIESGSQKNVGLETLDKLARVLKVPAKDLLK